MKKKDETFDMFESLPKAIQYKIFSDMLNIAFPKEEINICNKK